MSAPELKIAGGTVYDPTNGIDGQIRDIWVHQGRIVSAPSDPSVRAVRTIDARGLVVMPGGIDMHCHIAGPKVNAGPQDAARGKTASAGRCCAPPPLAAARMGSVPSTFATGYKYAGLGYTTAFDAAVPPLAARHVHEEFDDTPCIDKGFYVVDGQQPLHHAADPATTSPSG